METCKLAETNKPELVKLDSNKISRAILEVEKDQVVTKTTTTHFIWKKHN